MNRIVLMNLSDVAGDRVTSEKFEAIIEKYACPKNRDIEDFLKTRALDFTRKKISVSYLALDETGELLGFFTLANKTVSVDASSLSGVKRRRLRKFAGGEDESGVFHLSAYLIAQFGRNFGSRSYAVLTGDDLMELAVEKIREVQGMIGGGAAFLECEDKEKLLNFYQREPNCFFVFGERYSEKDGRLFKQLIRFI